MKKRGVNKLFNKIIIIPVAILVVLCVALTAVLIVLNSHDDIYKMVSSAVKNSQSQSQFYLGFETTTQASKGDSTYKTDTGGVIFSMNDMEDAVISINAVSSTPHDSSSDYNVTASFYSDGENVYDITSGKKSDSSVTPKEFKSIIEDYSLYMYDEKYVTNAVFNENQLEEFKGSGEVTVTLSSPGDEVLEEYAGVISELTGEKIKKSDLKVNAAFVSYVIYDLLVQSQTYTFSVEYMPSDGEKINYTVSSYVSFSDEFESAEEYDQYKSYLIEEE